jgi:putrescine transport system ATP-binding protein
LSDVVISGLTLRYGSVTALDGLDLEIGAGEIFVLVGGSGSGKTTLLRCAGGFLAPEAGRIAVGGRDITDLPPHLRPVNTMFQSYALFPHMDVAGNIAFGLQRGGLGRAEIGRRVEELLELVRLPGFGRRRIASLSGGQQQRVALARSVAPRPQLLLLDEPLSALDRGLREETRADLVALLRRLAITAILVTHDQEEALATADRIGVLHQGRLMQLGAPATLYERPTNRFVAGFLGAASILPATVRASDGQGVHLDLPGGAIALAPPGPQLEGEAMFLALRPERLRIMAADAGGDGVNRLAGVVEHCAYVGAAISVVLRLEDGSALRVSHALNDGLDAMPAPGALCAVGWAPEACILLRE